jgi:metal-dependent hydrolase (beta-lactamase superfamily II)
MHYAMIARQLRCKVHDLYFCGSPDNKITKRYRVVPGKSIHAEHGLFYYVETTIAGKTSACMFDYGLDPVGVLNNMSLLGIDVAKANAFTLSHGHFDHYMAAVEMLKQNQTRVRKGAPFYVGEEAFYHRFSLRPGTTEAADPGQLKKEEMPAEFKINTAGTKYTFAV